MESEFSAAVASWNAFYGAVAGVAATLVGLLFVSLALNPAVMGDDAPAGLRIWAAQSFHSFLMALVVSLVALIPGDTPEIIAITLVIIGVTGALRVVRDALQARLDPDPEWRTHQALMRFLSPALAYGICLWAAADVWQGDADALGWLVAVVFLLTMSAASSSWELLKVVGRQNATRPATRGSDAAPYTRSVQASIRRDQDG